MRDTITRYFDEVGRLTLPTKKEERAGFVQYGVLKGRLITATDPHERRRLEKEKTRLGGRLAEGYLRFVIGKARDRTRDDELLAEFISAGNEGLLIAVEKYDPTFKSDATGKPVRFLTYAAYWISVKMDEVLHRRGTVHLSVHLRKQTMQRGEGPVDPTMTPLDDVQLAVEENIERNVTPEGSVALRQLHAAGLDRRERAVLTWSLGLRGVARNDVELAHLLYVLDGSVFVPGELHQIRERALQKVRAWHVLNPDARDELVF